LKLRSFEPGLTPQPDPGAANPAADRTLIDAALRGDPRAHAALAVRLRFVARVLRSRNGRLGGPLDDHELEDVVQDTITKIWENIGQFRGASTLESWMYPVAVRTLSNAVRDRRARGQWIPRDAETDPEHLLAEHDEFAGDAEALTNALSTLDPERAEAIRSRHVDGASFDEIGSRLGVPPDTAKTWYYRGIARIRAILGRGGEA